MNSDNEPRLDDLLKDWQPKVDLPPRFESEVWRRIALAEEKRAGWFDFDWLFAITCQPRLALAIVATAVILGSDFANWQARQNYHHEMAAAESRYFHSVNPFAKTFLTSNP